MERVFNSQAYGIETYKHYKFPVYKTHDFYLYRCVEFKDEFYGVTASKLFQGNLRYCTGRYSAVFPNQKISYWADSPETARAEIKKHGAGNSILTFHAYDDASSTFPTLWIDEPLVIIDARNTEFQGIIDKIDNGKCISKAEENEFKEILSEQPDCIAFNSHARKNGENFIFLEKGFKKLSLSKLSLRFGRENGGNHNSIVCTVSSDYSPITEAYGYYFQHRARIGKDFNYMKSKEYIFRESNYQKGLKRIQEFYENK